ncbi:MAG: hypothetical protein ACYDBW_10015 [Sulfuricaulis sp.]
MTKPLAVFFVSCTILLSACLAHMTATNVANQLNYEAEKKGSPYRWHVVDLPGDQAKLEQRLIGAPSKTVADATVQKDVLAAIGKTSTSTNSNQPPTLVDVRLLSRTQDTIVEAWLVSWGERRAVYSVSMKTSAQGGVSFEAREM